MVIQGFGNVGGMAAKLMRQAGMSIISIIEWDGAVYNPHGIDVETLMEQRRDTGSIRHSRKPKTWIRNEAMFLECDVSVPAAKENEIHSGNADKLRCRIVCEGANGPTTVKPTRSCATSTSLCIPDILANAGGVTVSYFEWVQDRQGYFWNEQLVNARLEEIMVNAFNDVVAYRQSHKVNTRLACYMLAMNRVAFALKVRGLYA